MKITLNTSPVKPVYTIEMIAEEMNRLIHSKGGFFQGDDRHVSWGSCANEDYTLLIAIIGLFLYGRAHEVGYVSFGSPNTIRINDIQVLGEFVFSIKNLQNINIER